MQVRCSERTSSPSPGKSSDVIICRPISEALCPNGSERRALHTFNVSRSPSPTEITMSETRIPFHPYAELFPPMTSAEFYGLCADIARLGLQEEIVLYEGKILDGRSRYLACLLKGVTPRFREYAGECGGSALAFVASKNIHRRHLTDGQRAWLASRLKPLFEEEAQLRQRAGLKVGDSAPRLGEFSQTGKHEEYGPSAQKAAQLMKVSDFSVKAADTVKNHGVPQLADALAAGKIAVSTAACIAKLPAEQQHAVVAAVATSLKPKQALAQVTHSAANH
jgi:hypothetical protein